MLPNRFLARSRSATRIAFFLTLTVCCALLASGAVQAQTFTVLHKFHGAPDGSNPEAGVIVDASGNIYGTTYWGGIHYKGTAFKIIPSDKEIILYNFLAAYGANPDSTLVRDAKGTLYGVTFRGGAYDVGAVYKLDKKGNASVLYSFHGQADGYEPNPVIRDLRGNLYGTTVSGGGGSNCYYSGCGVVFKLNGTGKMTLLYTFTGGTDGGNPYGALVQDSAGNLYGGTWAGGDVSCNPPYGCGTIFKIDTTGTETVLYSFTGGNDGAMPVGFVRDEKGDFYGATYYGGGSSSCTFGCGTVFKLEPSGKETVLHQFTGSGGDGASPRGGVALDPAGNVYGTTEGGGGDTWAGTVFVLDPNGKETILHSFTGGADGSGPQAGVVLDSAGGIYGTAGWGGDPSCGYRGDGCGTVFKITP